MTFYSEIYDLWVKRQQNGRQEYWRLFWGYAGLLRNLDVPGAHFNDDRQGWAITFLGIGVILF